MAVYGLSIRARLIEKIVPITYAETPAEAAR